MSHCGFWLRKAEAELVKARLKRLEAEAKCWKLTKECLEAIKRIKERLEELDLPER